ncbi:hypothetical protein [uncultured Jatrophihabitans sp.]|uniref:hypothetical protein n=1 Tax=uncultured Jatrophihabitans sp. TaxID=1610747 RepID=UPI0035CBA96A
MPRPNATKPSAVGGRTVANATSASPGSAIATARRLRPIAEGTASAITTVPLTVSTLPGICGSSAARMP